MALQLVRSTSSRQAQQQTTKKPADPGLHMDLVRFAAQSLIRRLPASHVQEDDLYSAGLVALVEAARRFDPARGVEFRSFALFRIRGAMMDELRQHDTVSRHRRHGIRNGNLEDDAPRLVDLVHAELIPDLDADVENHLERRRLLARLRAAERRLPERYRLVLRLRLESEWTLGEIAAHLGVTEGRACQIVNRGLRMLREHMEAAQAVGTVVAPAAA